MSSALESYSSGGSAEVVQVSAAVVASADSATSEAGSWLVRWMVGVWGAAFGPSVVGVSLENGG